MTCRRAFTLVELLVVVAIISLLIAMLLPALNKARELAVATTCLAQLRQNGTMINMYAMDNKMMFGYLDKTVSPQRQFAADFLIGEGYVQGRQRNILLCPAHLPKKFSASHETYGFRWDFWPSGTVQSQKPASAGFGDWVYLRIDRFVQPSDYFPMMDSHESNASGKFIGQKSRMWPKGASRWSLAHLRHADRANAVAWDGHAEPLDADGLERTNVTAWWDAEYNKIGN